MTLRCAIAARSFLALLVGGSLSLVSATAAWSAPIESAPSPLANFHAPVVEQAHAATPIASAFAKVEAPHAQAPVLAAAGPAMNPGAPAWAKELALRVPNIQRTTWQSRIHGDPEQLGTSKGMYNFRSASTADVKAHLDNWMPLARKLFVAPSESLKADVSPEQAQQMVAGMEGANIGTHIPEDGCYARADVTAMAIRRAGFDVVKVNVVAPNGKPLKADSANTPTGSITWGYHVAPAVRVEGKLMVIDASLFDHPVTVDEWKAAMHQPDARVVVTSADQLSYGTTPQTGEARIRQFASNLGLVESVRRGYQPIRAHALIVKN